MHRSTLPRRARAHAPGWSHPYPADPFSPVFYADGDQDADTDDTDDDADAKAEGDADANADKGDDADADDADTDADPEGADGLGDKGKKALAAMKVKLKAERERRRTVEAQLQDKTAVGGDADQIQAKADAAATARANGRIVRSELKAAATGKLINPKDALTFIDVDQFEVDDDGQVDEDEIADAIDDLLKERPYLAAATAKRFQGTGDGGAARKAGRPKQLTQQDLKTMAPEAIDKARIDGRLDDLMGGK
ncbi:hypothetical protein [Streptomyces sp. NPDC050535]|uniref:hypothetical protein n=1 Tax=Streptomyces sp. NPDC050535 TaxID=3365626 RepID=UPI0037AA43E5